MNNVTMVPQTRTSVTSIIAPVPAKKMQQVWGTEKKISNVPSSQCITSEGLGEEEQKEWETVLYASLGTEWKK